MLYLISALLGGQSKLVSACLLCLWWQNTPNLGSCQPLKTRVVGVSCMELFLWIRPRLSLETSGVFFPRFVCVAAWKALLHVSDTQIMTDVFVHLFAAKPNCFVRITDYKSDLEMLEKILVSSCREGKRFPSGRDRPCPAAGTRGSPRGRLGRARRAPSGVPGRMVPSEGDIWSSHPLPRAISSPSAPFCTPPQ